jgi:O-antigen/teichoic acid export membrane protein
MDPREPDDPFSAELEAPEIIRRAKAGVLLVGARGVLVRALTLAGFVALAARLSPSDFGLLALGQSIMGLSGYLADFGLAGALIRRPEPPTRRELGAVQGFSLVLTFAVTAVVTAASLIWGGKAFVTALMVGSLPLVVLRTSPAIVLERGIQYRALAAADIAEALTYVVLSVIAAYTGLGVAGVAAVSVVRPFVGYVIVSRAAGWGVIWPNTDFHAVRPILAFGAKAGSGHLVNLAREWGLNAGTGAIAGLAPLGIWSLVGRLMQAPQIVIDSMLRVAFPAVSRLSAVEADLRRLLQKAAGLAAVYLGLILGCLVVASQHLLPDILGSQWADTADVLRWASLGVLISAPISAVAYPYLLAVDRAGRALMAVICSSATALVVGLGLLPFMGVEALGLGALAGGVCDYLVLGQLVDRGIGSSVRTAIAGPVAAACLGVFAGVGATNVLGQSLLGSIVATAITGAVFCACAVVMAPSQAHDARATAGGMLTWRRQPPAEPAT